MTEEETDGAGDDGPKEGALHADRDVSSDAHAQPERKLLVVGIGASAGGLEALAELIKHLSFDHMAFVVVQHLAAQHESFLAQLLSRDSKMKVLTAADGVRVAPNHIYVIPPNTDLALMNGVLHLIEPPGGGRSRLPIDFFFRSLADDQGASAIGVVLSGTGTDGSFGLRAIKAAGGLTFVQEPSSAKYDGMPRSALSSGCADFCLTPAAIAEELVAIGKYPRARNMLKARLALPMVQDQLAKLFVLIRAEFGNDLSLYKSATIERRVERRMTLHKLSKLEDYVRYAQSNAEELRALYKDMLITVTSFFRDHDPFDALTTLVFPQLIQHRGPQMPIRVWVPASATGEEAYSLAICLLEFLESKSQAQDVKVQIFGTDLDDLSIQHARRGIYPENIATDVSPERLDRFFVKTENGYQICRRIRDMVVFSQQNLLKDAPFSRIDLVSCRNVLIYLQPAAQKKALRILHYALNPSGFLMLGTSETVGDVPDLFSLIDRKNKIYSKKHATSMADFGFGTTGIAERGPPIASARTAISLHALADRRVLEMYGPPGVVINENMEILHFRGRTGPYLDPTPGAASFNLLRVARPDLHIELKRGIQDALSGQTRVTRELTFHQDGEAESLRIDILPLQEPDTRSQCLLVLFQKLPPPREIPVMAEGQGDARLLPLSLRAQELERELAATKDYLQTVIEEKESSSEELKSSNEELQSSNEELQSTNEELETSKEEMQSTNEELTTVNEELQNRMAELSQTNDDFHNVLAGVGVAVVIVGMDLRIRRFTIAGEKLLNLVGADIGRSIGFIEAFTGNVALAKKASAVIENLASYEEELLCADQRWYALRISPYRTLDHAIRGAVISLTDVDARKKVTDMTKDLVAYVDRFLAPIDQPLLLVDAKLRVVWGNGPCHQLFRFAPDEIVDRALPTLGREWADPKLRELLEGTASHGKPFQSLVSGDSFPGLDGKRIVVKGSRIPAINDAVLILLAFQVE